MGSDDRMLATHRMGELDVLAIGDLPATAQCIVFDTATKKVYHLDLSDLMDSAEAYEYEPAETTDWPGDDPDTIAAALDALASARQLKAFTPTTGADWPDPDPTTVQTALDQLASERQLKAFTPTTSGDWDGPPATIQAALDELASRVTAVEGA